MNPAPDQESPGFSRGEDVNIEELLAFTLDQNVCPPCHTAANNQNWPHDVCLFHLGGLTAEAELRADVTAALNRKAADQ